MSDYLPVKPWWVPRFIYRWMIFEIVKVLRGMPLNVHYSGGSAYFDGQDLASKWYYRVANHLQKELEK